MGTPEFAVPALDALIDSRNHKVVAVFSQKPKPKGRYLHIHDSAVSKLANDYNIPVYTPSTLRNDEALKLVQSINADIIVVAAYGFIIPKNILDSKKYGCLNIHPSKLPKYRGAAPLQRTIINGEKETAVCIMQMDENLDTGDILMQRNFDIPLDITLQELHDKCATLGAEMLIDVLDNITNLIPKKQDEKGATYAHKLTKKESIINWEESAFFIDCKVRGMNPWPGVYFEYQTKKIKIIKAQYLNIEHKELPGTILDEKNKFLDIACKNGALRILQVQPEGKKIMDAKDWQRGILKNFSVNNRLQY